MTIFRKVLSLVIATFSATLLISSLIGSASAVTNFTGNAAADFAAVSDAIKVTDTVGDSTINGTNESSGWDIQALYFDYDYNTDRLYVGIDCVHICGDADNDGNPGAATRTTPGGSDFPDLSNGESIALMFDTNNDGTFDVIAGVSANGTIANFGTYRFNGSPYNAANSFGAALPNQTVLFANPSAAQPDIEFTIANFTTLPGFNVQPGQSFNFSAYAYAGTPNDGNIGEDYAPSLNTPVNIPAADPASLGDYVWYDTDMDGEQDDNESGVQGVTVRLLNTSGTMIKETSTDSSGFYLFPTLDRGTYSVEFVLPSGYRFTSQNSSDSDSNDSDAATNNGRTEQTQLEWGEDDRTWDAGIYRLASLGDCVWYDANLDGVYQNSEQPVVGVDVHLYSGTNRIASTKTAQNCRYSFSDLVPGDYYVKFDLPAGYSFTKKDQGDDDGADSDADLMSGVTHVTNLQAGENDTTLDAGLYQVGCIGDYIWIDANQNGIQDEGEQGVENITVKLYSESGELVEEQKTSVDGFYKLCSERAGSYYAVVDSGDKYLCTAQNASADDTIDSDANADCRTDPYELVLGEDNFDLDIGLIENPNAPPPTVGTILGETTDQLSNTGFRVVSVAIISLVIFGGAAAYTYYKKNNPQIKLVSKSR